MPEATDQRLLIDPLRRYLARCEDHTRAINPLVARGRLTRVAGLVMEATGLDLPVGSACAILPEGENAARRGGGEAEVVGFSGEKLFLMPTADIHGLRPGAAVLPLEAAPTPPRFMEEGHPWRRAEDRTRHLPVGAALLGRVIDANGNALDQLGPIASEPSVPLTSRPINPIDREPISTALDVGVRAINALLTVGRGQRMGLFAGSGVGKSVLLGMMARYTTAEVIVVGLIGERGREVKEFIEQILGPSGLARSVVIAAPADTSPLLRTQGAIYAAAMAEHFRNEGRHVLLIMDSLTRFAMAQREIALAIGEPPATKGYPPSVFARLPQLVERAGNGVAGAGSITAFYTVLTEGDDQQDPIADAARAILDGHIVLSRQLAEAGHYPAIDVEQSISRVMHSISTPSHLNAARRLKQLYSRLQKARDLIAVGAYVPGNDALLDRAISLREEMDRLLRQDLEQKSDFQSSVAELERLLAFPDTRANG